MEAIIQHGVITQQIGERSIEFDMRGVDQVEDTWQAEAEDAFVEGSPYPDLPGCIMERVRRRDVIPGALYEFDITARGDARGTKPTKILNRGKRRTLETGWDERAVRYLSWHADWKPCTGIAASGLILCEAHGFLNGQRVYFARTTGGSGITPQSSTSLGVGYYVCDRAANQFRVSASPGGAPLALGTDITAGEVIAAEFALGAPHPQHPTLFLTELQVEDENTDWKIASAAYRGLEEGKPFHRMTTVNGQSFSSSEPMTISLAGGWEDPRPTNFHLPEVVVTDTYLVGSGTLPTSAVPSFATPPNPPAVQSLVLTGDADKFIWNYPYGWTLVATPHAATLNSQVSAMAYSLVYRYIWPVMLR